jgi:SLT domain-containing protein
MEAAGTAVLEEDRVKKAVATLCAETDELLTASEDSKRKVTTFRDHVSRLQQVQLQLQQKSNANHDNNSGVHEAQLNFECKEVQMNLEKAQADSVVSFKRISVAKTTSKLFNLISTTEKAIKTSEQALGSKCQARLHSQVRLLE